MFLIQKRHVLHNNTSFFRNFPTFGRKSNASWDDLTTKFCSKGPTLRLEDKSLGTSDLNAHSLEKAPGSEPDFNRKGLDTRKNASLSRVGVQKCFALKIVKHNILLHFEKHLHPNSLKLYDAHQIVEIYSFFYEFKLQFLKFGIVFAREFS